MAEHGHRKKAGWDLFMLEVKEHLVERLMKTRFLLKQGHWDIIWLKTVW